MAEPQGSWQVNGESLIFLIDGESKATIQGAGITDGIFNAGRTSFTSDDLNEYLNVTKVQDDSASGVITLNRKFFDNGEVTLELASGASYYLALSNDATGGTSYGYETLSATWKIENGTASYYAAGTSQGWSLSGNSMAVNYTAENQNSVLAAITGFNGDITDNTLMQERVKVTEWSAGTSGIILLKRDAFSGHNALNLVQGSGSYSLSLAAEVVKFDAGSTVSGYSPSVTVDTENASASIVRLQTKGWSLASASEAVYSEDVTKILAKITGLSGTVSTDNISFTVNTQPNGTLSTTVQMALGSLSDTVANIADEDTADNYTFVFSLSGNVTKPGEYFINPALSSVENGSASVIGTKYAGWSLSTGTGGNSFINYTAASQSTLATITGLSVGATIDDTPNISLSGVPNDSGSTATIGVVLQTAALSTTESINAVLADNYETDGFTFKFFLSDDVSEPGKYFVNPELKFPETANGSASIIGTKTAGWSLSTTFDKVYYTASSQSILAKITSLSNAATISGDSNVFLSGLPTGSGSQATISVDVAESALAKIEDTPATVTDNYETDGFTFKFGLSGSPSTPGNQYGEAFLNIAASTADTSMATVERNLTDGWSLSTAFDKVYYTAASTAILAEIKGLSTGATISGDNPNISLSGTTATGLSSGNIQIILQKGALISASGTPVELTDKVADDSFTFALATSGVSAPAEKYANFALSSVTNGSASIMGSKFEGWTVDASASKVTYTPKIESILATISGLSTGAKITDTANISLMGSDSTIVQLQKGALSFAESIPLQLTKTTAGTSTAFSLSLAADIPKPFATLVANTPALSSVENGSASIMGTKSEGWTLDGLSVTYAAPKYSILGTITGLSMGASAAHIALTGSDSTIITLKDGSLSQTGITLDETDAGKYGFSLAFDSAITGKNDDGSVGFKSIYYWEKAKGNPTAYYKSDKAEGWVLAGDSHSVTYTGRYKPTIAGQTPGLNVATITNLNSSISSIDGVIEGISVAEVDNVPRIVLSKDVLATSDQAYTITLTRGLSFKGGNSTDTVTVDDSLYGLSLVYTGSGSVPQELVQTTAWTKLGLTSQYSSISAAYWELKGGNNNTQIQYTPQVNGEVLAEVQGLNKDVTAEDLNVMTVEGASAIIQLRKNALTTNDVSLTEGIKNYSLSLFRSISPLNQDRVVAPELTNQAWVVTGTTAKYTAKVTEGYEVANDEKSIIYAAAGDSVALATITGLAGGLSISPNKRWIGIYNSGTTSKGLQFVGGDDKNKAITLTNDVLTNSNVALTTTSVGRNYSLSLGSDVLNESGASASTGVNVWRLNGTTAEYKKVLYAHYSLSSTKATNDKITYTPEADVEGGLSVKVTGLKSGLAVAADGSHIGVATVTGGVSSITAALKLNDPNDKQIYLTGEVLGTTNVSLSGTGYTFNLDGATSLKPAMQDDSLKWSVNSTTAELRGIKSAGYSVASDNQSINYIAQDSNYLLAGVSGLKSGLATNNGKITGISLSGTDKTITLDNRVLGQSNVTLVNKELANYKLLLDTETAGTSVATVAASITAWYTTKDTATSTSAAVFKNAKEAYFELASGSLAVTYKPRVDETTIATITGLKDTIKAANDKIAGIDLIAAGGKSYTISESVLNKKNATVSVTGSDYTFKLADTATPKEKGSRYWAVNSTTANYQYNTTAGYTQASLNGNITYQEERTASNPNIIASITGIKSGIASSKIGNYIDVVGISGASTMFRLGSEVLGTESIAIVTGSAAVAGASYTIVLKDPTKSVKEDQLGWKQNGDSLALVSFREAGFSSAGGSTKLDYYDLLPGASIASVSGLKTKLTINTTTLQIAGISINNTDSTKPFAVLESSVLNSKDVTIKDLISSDNIVASLSLAKPVDYAPKYTMTWSVKSGTATLKEALVAGYSAVEDATNGNYIKYSPKDNVTTTITGLGSGAKAINKNWSVAGISLMLNKDDPTTIISQSSAVYNIPRKGTFVIADSVLAKKDLVLNSGASYGLSLANADNYLATGEHGNFKETWMKDANSTKATYVNQTDTEGYVGAGESGKYTIKYYAKDAYDVLATLNGVNKDITAAELLPGDHHISVSSSEDTVTSGSHSGSRTITILDKAVLTNTNLTVGANDKFILALGNDSGWTKNDSLFATEQDAFAVHDAVASYVYSKGTVTVQAGKTEGWRINTITPKGSTSSVKDPKTIIYEKAAPLTIATVTGLKSNLADSVVSAGFAITEWDRGSASTGKGVIRLSNPVLNEKDVKLTVPTKLSDGTTGTYGFSFALDTDIIAPIQGENKWVASATQAKKGTLYYQYTTAAGYSLASISSTTLKYSKDTDTVLATITGLKNMGSSPISQTELNGIAVTTPYSAAVGSNSAASGIITLSNRDILGTSVKVANGKGEYVFNIADDIEVKDQNPKWFLSGTTGTYRQYSTEGWKLNGTSTTATYQKETGGDTLVTVKGLKKGLTADKLNDEITGLVVNTSDSGVGTIKLTSDFEGTTTISLTDGYNYKNSSGSSVTSKYTFEGYTAIDAGKPYWAYKKGTATLKEDAGTGFIPDADVKKLTYKKGTTYTLATITGLAGNLKFDENYTADTSPTKGAIYSGESASSGSVVSLNESTGYITLGKDALTNKKVTLKNGKDYAGEKTDYMLKLGAGIRETLQTATEWVLNGSTGTYKNYNPSYYIVGSNSTVIEYKKPTAGTTYATVTGLNKNTATADLLNANWKSGDALGGVLTVTKDMLGTATIKMTAKTANTEGRDTFTLALGNDVGTLASSLNVSSSANANNGKAKITGRFTQGFYLENGNKTLTYTSAKNATKDVTVATVTGITGSVRVNDGIITLNEGNLNKKNVTVVTSKGNVDYKLAMFDGITNPTLANTGAENLPYNNLKEIGGGDHVDPVTWTNPKGTGTLKGYITEAGYTMAGSSTSITYTAATTATKKVNVIQEDGSKQPKDIYKSTAKLATIKGLQSNAEITHIETEGEFSIELSGSNTNGNLSIDAGVYNVNVSDYSGKTITGSAKADNITVDGNSLTITGGKGDDLIDLGSANSNTFVYSNGDGNDVIAKFALGQDKLQIKSGTIAIKEVQDGDEDIVVKVGTGSITLQGLENITDVNEITIYNAKNVATTYAVPHASTDETTNENVLLADNNYRMDAAQLSDIIKPAAAQYTPYDFTADFSLTKEEKFTPEITYTDKK